METDMNAHPPQFDRRRLNGAFLCALAAAVAPAWAQDKWPARPIKLVLPYAAGGPADYVTRVIGQMLAKQLGQSVVVDNRPGGGTLIGSDAVAKSPADGYALLITGNAAVANVLLRPRMPYADADLVPVVQTHTAPSVIFSSAASGVTNLKELKALAQRKGGLTFGTAGAGSTGNFVGEMLRAELDVPVTLVHYKSGAETINAMLGGQIDLASEAVGGVRSYIAGGKLRALGVTSNERTPLLPQVATTTEQGYPSINIQHWGGIYAPRGTPPAVLDRIVQALHAAIQADPGIRVQFESTGNELAIGTRAEFEQFTAAEKKRLGKVVADSKMSLE
jgi:tripartite-type tricarboxylate transporter receptor subunit TctC